MDTKAIIGQNEVVSNMAGNTPTASYKKTVLGKLLLKVWDSMTNTGQELVFAGDPANGEETVFDVFSEKEKVYFERMNRYHFNDGSLISYSRHVDEVKERGFESYTDDELTTIINSKYMAFTNTINKINSIAVLFRMRSLAQELEKSDKIIAVIDARQSELQAGESAPTAMPVSE